MKSFQAFTFLCLLPLASLAADSPSFRGGSEHPGVYDSPPLTKFTQVKWKFSTHGKVFSSPAVTGNTILFGSTDHFLYAVDLATQKPAWEFATDGQRKNGATYTKPDGSPNYEAAYAGDFYDDIVVGVQRLMTAGGIYASPVLSGGVLYIASTDGSVYALI